MTDHATYTAMTTSHRTGHRILRGATRTVAGAAVAASLLLGAAPAQAVPTDSQGWHPVSGTDRVFQAENGIALNYHYYAQGVDWAAPAGAVFYFDGDGTTRFDRPEGRFAARVAQAAAQTNRAFVFVEAPYGTRSWRGQNADRYAEAVVEFAVTNIAPTTDDSVLLAGYSGGAEFVSRQLLSQGADWLPAGSGAVLIGGGGNYGYPIAGPTGTTDDLELAWVVGARDGYGATGASSWSAKEATAQAVRQYRAAGYDQTQRIVTAGDHGDYDIPAIIDSRLAELER